MFQEKEFFAVPGCLPGLVSSVCLFDRVRSGCCALWHAVQERQVSSMAVFVGCIFRAGYPNYSASQGTE